MCYATIPEPDKARVPCTHTAGKRERGEKRKKGKKRGGKTKRLSEI
jgi:hypothetical protein